jgi:hypothetical protein
MIQQDRPVSARRRQQLQGGWAARDARRGGCDGCRRRCSRGAEGGQGDRCASQRNGCVLRRTAADAVQQERQLQGRVVVVLGHSDVDGSALIATNGAAV